MIRIFVVIIKYYIIINNKYRRFMRNFEEEENIKEQKQAVGVGGSLRYILFWQEIKFIMQN